jgi:hypothetical protein
VLLVYLNENKISFFAKVCFMQGLDSSSPPFNYSQGIGFIKHSFLFCRGLIHQAHRLIIRRELDSSNIPFYFVGA